MSEIQQLIMKSEMIFRVGAFLNCGYQATTAYWKTDKGRQIQKIRRKTVDLLSLSWRQLMHEKPLETSSTVVYFLINKL